MFTFALAFRRAIIANATAARHAVVIGQVEEVAAHCGRGT
jgi:hypothetical protein